MLNAARDVDPLSDGLQYEVIVCADQDEMVREAIVKTPAYKSRKQIGFSRICEAPKIDLDERALVKFTASLVTCRD